ncbi:MAG: araQ 7, partial [Chloroflexi bacterium]|nr:araQ 7 [Chloroflexota bacterium]
QVGTINWGALQAGVTVAMIPCVVLFLFLQRYYISGLTSGAVKA